MKLQIISDHCGGNSETPFNIYLDAYTRETTTRTPRVTYHFMAHIIEAGASLAAIGLPPRCKSHWTFSLGSAPHLSASVGVCCGVPAYRTGIMVCLA